eukprot:TRINITY_DN23138_c0_g1_i2.p1 TRINITY_DN23138_c0_g1~~TRINITY_DN23138_c0_g1_i2.p1  ORF type:complete len:147 (-),score=22.97 TRINITY_DN23138_c0_g1_i2:43-483(-)
MILSVLLGHDWASWAWLALASFLTGFAKAGVTGLGPLVTVIFARATPGGTKRALALIQPVLVVSDAAVFWRYRRELQQTFTEAPHLQFGLLAWTLLGVGLGQLCLGHFLDSTVRQVLAAVLAVLLISKALGHLLGSKMPTVQQSQG